MTGMGYGFRWDVRNPPKGVRATVVLSTSEGAFSVRELAPDTREEVFNPGLYDVPRGAAVWVTFWWNEVQMGVYREPLVADGNEIRVAFGP